MPDPNPNPHPARPAKSGSVTFHPLIPGGVESLRGAAVDAATIALLEDSFARLGPSADRLVQSFYDRLFDRYPGVRSMFPADMKAQRQKLLDSLKAVIDGLRSPGHVRDHLREMGQRHVKYGAKPEHYPLVCACLVDAMRDAAGAWWTDRHEAEWARALELISRIMLDGAGASGPGAR